MNSDLPPVVALIAGPTASGKSALAMAVAVRISATIVNADSAQVYAGLRAVTARPEPEEERQVPHRLFGHRDAARPCSAADWAAEAERAIADSHAEGRVPLLVGGTGLYLRTLLDGIAPVPAIDEAVRRAVRALPVADAHRALLAEDPAAAARLAPADSTRVARALEVVRSTGRPLAEWQNERRDGISARIRLVPLLLLPPRDWLAERTDARFERIVDGEGPAEVSRLLARGLAADLPAMRAIGVREIAGLIDGLATRAECIVAGQLATRRYAKRQRTWFSRQPPAAWPRLERPWRVEDADRLAARIVEACGETVGCHAPLDGTAPSA